MILVTVTTEHPEKPPSVVRAREPGVLEVRSGDRGEFTEAGTYDAAGWAELRELADATRRLPARLTAPGRSWDRPTVRWTFDDGREIEVRDAAHGLAPELDALRDGLYRLVRRGEAVTTWTFRPPGSDAAVTRRALGDAGTDVPVLEAIRSALYDGVEDPFAPVASPHGAGPPAPQDALVHMEGTEDGESTGGFAVAQDGRAWLLGTDGPVEVTRFEGERLHRLREAVAAVDWAAQPDPLRRG